MATAPASLTLRSLLGHGLHGPVAGTERHFRQRPVEAPPLPPVPGAGGGASASSGTLARPYLLGGSRYPSDQSNSPSLCWIRRPMEAINLQCLQRNPNGYQGPEGLGLRTAREFGNYFPTDLGHMTTVDTKSNMKKS